MSVLAISEETLSEARWLIAMMQEDLESAAENIASLKVSVEKK